MNALFPLHRRRHCWLLLELVLFRPGGVCRLPGLGPCAQECPLLHAIAFVAVMYAVAWFMFRRRWFVKV